MLHPSISKGLNSAPETLERAPYKLFVQCVIALPEPRNQITLEYKAGGVMSRHMSYVMSNLFCEGLTHSIAVCMKKNAGMVNIYR